MRSVLELSISLGSLTVTNKFKRFEDSAPGSPSNMSSLKFGQVVRQFSSTVAKHQLVKPPIQVYGIEGRYATALYSAAHKHKKLQAVEKDLNSLNKTMTANVIFRDFMKDPTQKIQDKQAILGEVAKTEKFTDLTVNLFGAMAENGRLGRLSSVVNSFNSIMSAERGEVTCTVTVAKPLDASTQKELKTILQGFLKKEDILFLTTKVDQSIIGGMVVDFPDKSIDMSLSRKIGMYTEVINQAV